MIAVHKMVPTDDKEGAEWLGAVVANAVLFRPTITCKMEQMQQLLRKDEQNVRIRIKRLDREITLAEKEFARLQKKNQSASHIRASVRLLHLKRIGRNRFFDIAYQITLSIQELSQMEAKITQQQCMNGMAHIYARLCNSARKTGMDKLAERHR